MSKHRYRKLATEIVAIVNDWDRQWHELACARSGLEPEDRMNEQAENERIYHQQDEQIRMLIEERTGVETMRAAIIAVYEEMGTRMSWEQFEKISESCKDEVQAAYRKAKGDA